MKVLSRSETRRYLAIRRDLYKNRKILFPRIKATIRVHRRYSTDGRDFLKTLIELGWTPGNK